MCAMKLTKQLAMYDGWDTDTSADTSGDLTWRRVQGDYVATVTLNIGAPQRWHAAITRNGESVWSHQGNSSRSLTRMCNSRLEKLEKSADPLVAGISDESDLELRMLRGWYADWGLPPLPEDPDGRCGDVSYNAATRTWMYRLYVYGQSEDEIFGVTQTREEAMDLVEEWRRNGTSKPETER